MRYPSILLACVMLLTCLCSCDVNTVVSDTVYTVQYTELSEESTPAPSENGKGYVRINGVYAVDEKSAVIGGMCTDGSTVSAVGGGREFTAQSRNGVFFITVDAEINKDIEYTVICNGAEEKVTVRPMSKAQSVDFYAGGNSQLFLKSHLDAYEPNGALSENTVNYLKKRLIERDEQVKNAGGRLIVAIVPTPQSIYGEYAPHGVDTSVMTPRVQLMRAMRDTGVCIVDLTDTLINAKDDGYPLVYQTDTHWTEYAAFKAYEVIHGIIKEQRSEIPTHTLNDFVIEEHMCIAGNFIDEGKDEYSEKAYFLSPKFKGNPLYDKVRPYAIQGAHIRDEYTVHTQNGSFPTCLFVRDSFSTGIMKFLCDDFSCVYMQKMWDHTVNTELLNTHKPDYVIHILSEANIKEILK